MSENSSNKPSPVIVWRKVIGLLLWVGVSFAVAQGLLILLAWGLSWLGLPLKEINNTMLQTIFAASVYLLTLVIAVGVPWWIKKSTTNKHELGLSRLPSWLDIGLAPAGFVIYMLVTIALSTLATVLIPGFDADQIQEIGFGNLAYRYEYLLAFATLVVIAPLAEEILFRGYLYGKLKKYLPVWVVIVITSVMFAVVHGQWNVAVDVFALSLVLCTLREITGSIWAGVLLHMLKNSVAFYLLFINPSLLNIIGG